MRSNNREYLPAVDHLRFGAAALVVVFHTLHNLWPQLAHVPAARNAWIYSKNPLVTLLIEGRTGVALFMVLSGFILTTGSLGREIHYRTFLRNRLLRVGPLYLLVLLVALAVSQGQFSLWAAVQTTLGFGRFPGGFTYGAFAVVLWTVGVELQFYVLFPVFLKLMNARGHRPIVQFVVFMAVLRGVAALSSMPGLDYDELTYYSLVGRIDQFLVGMLAAYAFPHIRRYVGRSWVAALAMATTTGGLWAYNALHGAVEPHVWRTVWVDVEALLWAGVLVGYVGTLRFGRGRLSAALAWAGERSYGIYLMHVPVLYIVMIRHWVIDVPGGPVFDSVVTAMVLVLPGGLLLSALGYSAVERPFLSLRKRYVSLAAVPSQASVTSVPPVPSAPSVAAGSAEATAGGRSRILPAQRAGA